MRQIAFGLVVLGAALGPVAPTVEGTFVLRLIVQMFFLLAGALWAMSAALEGRLRLRRTGMGAGVLLLGGAILSGVVNAAYRYPAALQAFSWAAAVLAFLFVLHEVRSRRARQVLIGAIGATAFCVALHGLHQIFVELPAARAAFAKDPLRVLRELNIPPDMEYDFEGRLGKDRIFSTFLLPNSLAGYLVLLLPMCAGMVLDRWARWRRGDAKAPILWRIGLTLPLLLALLFTRSKAGYLAFGVGAAAFAVWGFGRRLWRRKLHVACVALCVAVVLLIAQASGLLPPLRDYAGSSEVRYGYWRAGLMIVEKRPFVGVGLDNFNDFYAALKRPSDEEARRAHNDYVQLAAELGLIGLAAYGFFLARYWWRVWRRPLELVSYADSTDDRAPPSLPVVVLLSLALFLIEGLCGGSFRTTAGAGGWLWVAALWLAWVGFYLVFAAAPDERERPAGPSADSFVTVGMGCGLIGLLAHSTADMNHYVGGILQTAWLLMALLLNARQSVEPEEKATDRALGPVARLGLTLASAAVMLAVLYGFVLPLAEAQIHRERALDEARPLSLDARVREIQAAIRSNPWDAHLRALRSDMLVALWRSGVETTARGVTTFSAAVSSAREAVEINPMRAEYHSRLGRLHELRWLDLKETEDFQEALNAFLRAEELFPSNPDTALNLGRLYDRVGQTFLAEGKYRAARRLSEEQYHIPRQFTAAQLAELDRRIKQINAFNNRRADLPPLGFTEPRLLGWPARDAARR